MANLHDSSILRIAVASDLHAYQPKTEGGVRESYLNILGTSDSGSVDPLRDLTQLIDAEKIKADLLLSPGDLGNKACAEGIKYAWKSLHEIGNQLQAHLVTASSGNHDLNSRYLDHKVDPAETLQRLIPPYPLPDEKNNDKYWARKFALVQSEHYRLIVLNSAAYHGGLPEEIEYGRISDLTIDRIESELSDSNETPINIILCHHHPHQFAERAGNDDTKEVMRNGHLLLDLLSKGKYGNWIVIHGHKHLARVTFSQGGNSAPFVMAAGSFSAVIYPELQNQARNQFYLLELPLDNSLGLIGTIRSWDWTPRGWVPAMPKGSGLPAICKFGCRDNPQNLARRIDQALGADIVANWNDLLLHVPEVEFLLPSDLESLINVLNRKYRIKVELENDMPRELGRM
jgi:hypothetical protein